jgi:hypothetical protein
MEIAEASAAWRDTARDLAAVQWMVQGVWQCQVICHAILPADSQDARSDDWTAIAKR